MLTKSQQDIMQHRLDAVDAMAEVLSEDHPELFDYLQAYSDAVYKRSFYLVDKVCNPTQHNPLDQIDIYLLEDIVTDTAYVDLHEQAIGEDITQQKYNGIVKSYEGMVEKLESVINNYGEQI